MLLCFLDNESDLELMNDVSLWLSKVGYPFLSLKLALPHHQHPRDSRHNQSRIDQHQRPRLFEGRQRPVDAAVRLHRDPGTAFSAMSPVLTFSPPVHFVNSVPSILMMATSSFRTRAIRSPSASHAGDWWLIRLLSRLFPAVTFTSAFVRTSMI